MTTFSFHIERKFMPFNRRWRGWRNVLIYLWPFCWCLVEESPGIHREDYFDTANGAAIAMARRAGEIKQDVE